MHLLRGAEKHYAWGSRSAIQDLTGFGSSDAPLAEIWYGAHPSGPAILEDDQTLIELISDEGANVLGQEVAERFDGRLPFLVKLIAPGQAVSLQVHPSARRAREGFAEQISDQTQHKFVDGSHKPEQILALTRFDGLVGLLPVSQALKVLASFGHPLTRRVGATLEPGDDRAIRAAIVDLASASADDVGALVDLARALVGTGEHVGNAEHLAAETLLELAEQYPGDAGLAVSLMLRRVCLEPGDSVLVRSGVPHAYMSGLALEVMANSDNVFRLGLTAKHVDIDEAVANVITSPAHENRPHNNTAVDGADEFHLEVRDLSSGRVDIDAAGPRIVVCLAGVCTIHTAERTLTIEPGNAIFIAHSIPAGLAGGSGRVAVVSVPSGNKSGT